MTFLRSSFSLLPLPQINLSDIHDSVLTIGLFLLSFDEYGSVPILCLHRNKFHWAYTGGVKVALSP